MPYFLPIGLITIKGDWKKPGSTSEAPVTKAAESAFAPTDLEKGVTFGFLAKRPKSPASDDDSGGASAGQTITLTFDKWTVTITAEVETDPTYMFYAYPHRNYIFDDDLQVTVNSKHLLSAGKSTVNDRTADVIGAVASVISSLPLARANTAEPGLKSFLVSFRTKSKVEYEAAHKVLSKAGFNLGLLPLPPETEREPGLCSADGDQGLVFRLAEPYTLSMTYSVEGEAALDYKHVFALPGLQPYTVEYHRVAFVKKLQEVGFTDGMLTDYHESLPSPILGVLAIPKAIVGAIVPLVGGGSLGGSATTPTAPSTTVSP
jgi:hypothetical protein